MLRLFFIYALDFFGLFIKTKDPINTSISPKKSLRVKLSPKTKTESKDPNIGINNLNTPNWFAEWFCKTIVHMVKDVAVIKAPYPSISIAFKVKSRL